MPFGSGCAFGGFMPCDKWERSLSYQPKKQLTLWEQVFNEPDNCTEY